MKTIIITVIRILIVLLTYSSARAQLPDPKFQIDTTTAIVPGYDGNQAAQTNFRFIASHVYTTEKLKKVMINTKNQTK